MDYDQDIINDGWAEKEEEMKMEQELLDLAYAEELLDKAAMLLPLDLRKKVEALSDEVWYRREVEED